MPLTLPKLTFSWKSAFYSASGSFIITAGWNWYHLSHRPHLRFVLLSLLTWVVVFAGYQIFRWLYGYLTLRFHRHPFWQTEFKQFLDSLFFICSLLFVVFFFRKEWLSLAYFLAIGAVLFWRLQYFLSLHPDGRGWLIVNRNVFILFFSLFLLFGLLQYAAYHYYILDASARFYNIVLFRAWAITMFWVLGFALASLLYWRVKTRWRYLFLTAWLLLFFLAIVFWVVNIGIMYFSGLYLNPVMLGFAKGATPVIFNWLAPFLIGGGAAVLVVFALIFRQVIRAHDLSSKRYWYFYNFSLIAVALLSILGLTSFKNTPEFLVLESFYRHWRGDQQKAELSPVVQSKLERFGLRYNLGQFDISRKEKIFTSGKLLEPAKFTTARPNILIVFFESFSTRLTDVYNGNFKDLTPGLDKMAADKDTTIFHHYFNASTPTVTGIISQLCSILPPTGYSEIQLDRKLQRVYTLCLPQILKENGGYKYASYINAVDKDFENKGSILASMGVGDFYGTSELKKIIEGEPLSWGFSDHQLFPATWKLMNEKAKEPFLMMLSTVDTHPPFDLAKDMVKYGNGKNNVLNSVYTTDDAFSKFWDQFKNSKFAANTILIAVADHAIFPGAFTKDVFPNEAGKLSYYDENMFMMYMPDNILPKNIDMYSSGIDFTPTLLQILNINTSNSFEGHSIFDDRNNYPNLLGMHELGLYINEADKEGKRIISYKVPNNINCHTADFSTATDTPLTLCEYLEFYKWKRQMFEEGRLW